MNASFSPELPAPLVRLTGIKIAPFVLRLVPHTLARRYAVLPLAIQDGSLVVACANPEATGDLRAISTHTGRPLRVLRAGYAELRTTIAEVYGTPDPFTPPSFEDALVSLGIVDADELETAQTYAQAQGVSLFQALRDQKQVNDLQIAQVRGWHANLPNLRLGAIPFALELAPLVPNELALEARLVPIRWLANGLLVGMAQPARMDLIRRLAEERQTQVFPVVCPFGPWNRMFSAMYLRGNGHATHYETEAAEWLIKQGSLTEADLDLARIVAAQTTQPLSDVLLSKGLVSHAAWLEGQAHAFDVAVVPRRLGRNINTDGLEQRIPAPLAHALNIVPVGYDNQSNELWVAMTEPSPAVREMVQALAGMEVEPRLIAPLELERRQQALYGNALNDPLPRAAPTLSELLCALGVITQAQADAVTGTEIISEPLWARRMIEQEYLDETDYAEALSLQSGVPFAHLDRAHIRAEWIELIPRELAQRHQIFPLLLVGNTLWVAVADPYDAKGLREVEAVTGKRVMPLIGTRSVIAATVDRFYGQVARQLTTAARELLNTLVQKRVLTHLGAMQAAEAAATGIPLDVAIANASQLSLSETTSMLAQAMGVGRAELDLREQRVRRIDPFGEIVERTLIQDPVQPKAARLIDLETASRLAALPIAETGTHLTVAFADPLFNPMRNELSELLGKAIQPVLTTRRELEEAIERVLGRKNIGTRLLLAGVITRSQLNDALDTAARSGVRLGRALVARGYVTRTELARFLADQAQMPFFALRTRDLAIPAAHLLSAETERRMGVLPLAADANNVLLAVTDPFNTQAIRTTELMLNRQARTVVVSDHDLEGALEHLYGSAYLERSVSELLERAPEDSAFHVLTRAQTIVLWVTLGFSLIALLFAAIPFIIVLNSLSILFYLSFSIYKLYLVGRSVASSLEVPTSPEEIAAMDERNLPMYTILVPVYREAEVLPDILVALSRLDYPTTKLEVLVIMEEDDDATIAAFHATNTPPHFRPIVVPNAQPKTKPKSCNYGLVHAHGDYVVIYDAEDIPEPDQLKRVQLAFAKSSPEVVCIQSKLNYYNRAQNWLTAWFTVEYSMWFDLFLPGLVAAHAPVPLGGTSNHFKREALIEVGAWDPYNVTEDADLGVRLFKRGYRTAIVDSTTFEEANSELFNWIRQRSRWLKGYMQTWLVHMRNPVRLYRELGARGFFGFQMIIGGTFFAALLNPIYWGLTLLWFLTQAEIIQEVFPSFVFYAGMVCLLIGNFAFMYMNVAGAMRRGYDDMVKFALLSPIYWLLMSIGAWKGLWQLITNPFYWEKTKHGLAQTKHE